MRTRLVEVEDATALMNIYNPEVIETTVTFDLVARTLAQQESWISSRRVTHPCIVAVNEEDEIGERGARGENSVYVLRSARGRGVGEALVRELIATSATSGFHSLIARIVGENAGSIRLHEKCGFILVGTEIEVGRKHGQWLDVVEYQYVIPRGS
jgi:L-amino acid N-acyltransferase YncA